MTSFSPLVFVTHEKDTLQVEKRILQNILQKMMDDGLLSQPLSVRLSDQIGGNELQCLVYN